jgi:hypothetical protein
MMQVHTGDSSASSAGVAPNVDSNNLHTVCLSTEVVDPVIFAITIAMWLFMFGVFIGKLLATRMR